MANVNGVQINQTPTIVEKAGAAIDDVRNKILKYDTSGNVVLATAGTDIPVGIALVEAGYNDITGAESGKVASGDDVDIQIKDIGYVVAGAAITKGQEVTAGTGGKAAPAAAGNYVLGFALNSASANGMCKIQIAKYQKAPTVSNT
jgi:hypothetical protein